MWCFLLTLLCFVLNDKEASEVLAEACEYNGGAEGIEVKGGRLVMFCEDAMAGTETIHQGWVFPVTRPSGAPAEETVTEIYLRLGDGYRPTDLAFTPNGDLLVLERMHRGKATGMRIEVLPKRFLDKAFSSKGEAREVFVPARVAEVMQSPTSEIDNMEGLALGEPAGATALDCFLFFC